MHFQEFIVVKAAIITVNTVMQKSSAKVIGYLIVLTALVTAAVLGLGVYFSSSSIHELLTQNHQLNKAIRNLTTEQQIGYAVLQSQSQNALGEIESVVRFVQTAADNPQQVVSEQLFSVTGSVVHFDALIVKFDTKYVQEGKERALYLWRRIHGEFDTPASAKAIEQPGQASERYYSITKSLRLQDQAVFWEAIWDLANAPSRLQQYGVTAVYGNPVYIQMQAGKVYLFKISPSDQIYPEVVNRY